MTTYNLLLISLLITTGIAQAATPVPPNSAIMPNGSFIESKEALEKAFANPLPIQGTAVATLAGAQLTPSGAMPGQVVMNQEIFNDIDRLWSKMQNFMDIMTHMWYAYKRYTELWLPADRGQAYADLAILKTKMVDFIRDVQRMAIRYNKNAEFTLVITRLQDSMNTIEATTLENKKYNETTVVCCFDLIKKELRNSMIIIENALKQTKLHG